MRRSLLLGFAVRSPGANAMRAAATRAIAGLEICAHNNSMTLRPRNAQDAARDSAKRGSFSAK